MAAMKRERYVAYVGTYSDESSKGIHIFDLDINTGKMTKRKSLDVHNSSALIVSHSRRYLYSVEDEGVAAFKILPDGDLQLKNHHSIGGMRGCALAIDQKDQYLFVAGYHDGRVTMMQLNQDGSIGKIADGIFHRGMGIGMTDLFSQPHVTCVQVTPDEKFLCAVDSGLNHVKVYEIDTEKGKLKLSDTLRCQLDSAPKDLVFSKDGQFAYLLCEKKDCINIYRYLHDKGEFELLDTASTVYENDPEGCVPCSLVLSPDGKHLFCSNAGSNTVAIFAVDLKDGGLQEVCQSKISGDYPKSLTVMPDGKHFLSLNHNANEIVPFKIDYKDNYFLLHGKPVSIQKPNSICIQRLQ
jgi:6-phosphogluconolactonase